MTHTGVPIAASIAGAVPLSCVVVPVTIVTRMIDSTETNTFWFSTLCLFWPLLYFTSHLASQQH